MGTAAPESARVAPGRPASRVLSSWFERPWVDLAVAAMAAIAAALVSWRLSSWGLEELKPATRRALFQTLTTVSGTLLGLALTSISVLSTTLRQPISGLTARFITPPRKQAVARLFFAAVRALALSTVVCIYALVTDTETSGGSPWVQACVLAVAVLGALRIARTFWALSLIISTSVASPADVRPTRLPISDDEY